MLLSLFRKTFLLLTMVAVCSFSGVLADPVISDGSDGSFAPAGGIVTLNLPANGIFNFTTIDIPHGAIVKFNRNAQNTPVILAATGDVVISGQINISATATDVSLPPVPENPKQGSGPGGGGAIQISTAGSLTLEGSILSDGANGGWAHA